MPQTEQDLRAALRGLSAEPPEVTDLVGRAERGLRRRRYREVAMALVLVVLVALPLLRWLPGQLDRDKTLPANSVQLNMDARMKYAAFVAWWDGSVAGGGDPDADVGVIGVQVSTTIPPFTCAIARVADGEPFGTQAAWVLGASTMFGEVSPWVDVPMVTDSLVLWSDGVTNCATRPPGETLVFPPPSTQTLIAADTVFAQQFSDPSRPALDVAEVYHSIPQDQITDYGREVFAAYKAKVATIDFGTPKAQTERALTSLSQWVSVGVSTRAIHQGPPQVGPVVLDQGVDQQKQTVQLPAGFSVRWTDDGRFCVDGAVAGSPVRHVDTDSYPSDESYRNDELPTVGDGPCP